MCNQSVWVISNFAPFVIGLNSNFSENCIFKIVKMCFEEDSLDLGDWNFSKINFSFFEIDNFEGQKFTEIKIVIPQIWIILEFHDSLEFL